MQKRGSLNFAQWQHGHWAGCVLCVAARDGGARHTVVRNVHVRTALLPALAATNVRVGASRATVYRLLGSAENLLQHGAYGSTFRAFQKSIFQIIILKTAL